MRYLCVTIDTECDKGPKWRTREPLSFEGVHCGIRERLEPLFRAHGTRPTYFLSPEVMRNEACAEYFKTLLPAPHRTHTAELGTHLHHEFAFASSPIPRVTNAFQHDLSAEEEERALRNVTELFQSQFGVAPRAFRAGRFGIGKHTLKTLAELGYWVDSSVTPLVSWKNVGGPDFRLAPNGPYFPSDHDPSLPGTSSILEVPLSIVKRRFLPTRFASVSPLWLRPTFADERSIRAIVDSMFEEPLDDRPRVLTCMFHNVELIADGSPYVQEKKCVDRVLGRIELLLSLAKERNIPTVGISDLVKWFAPHQGAYA